MPPPGPVSPTTHAPPAAQVKVVAATVVVVVLVLVVTIAAFFTPRATVLAVFEFSLVPPQAPSAIAATASSANFLD